MPSNTAQRVLERVFPSGIPANQFDLAARIAAAVDAELTGSKDSVVVHEPGLEYVRSPNDKPGNSARVTFGPSGELISVEQLTKKDVANLHPTIAALIEGGTVGEIAQRLGIVRQAVDRQVRTLEKRGAEFVRQPANAPGKASGQPGRPGMYYRLVKVPRSLGQPRR